MRIPLLALLLSLAPALLFAAESETGELSASEAKEVEAILAAEEAARAEEAKSGGAATAADANKASTVPAGETAAAVPKESGEDYVRKHQAKYETVCQRFTFEFGCLGDGEEGK